MLDTRQYRDANSAADNAAQPKTMLGREQLTWLKDSLAGSDATWKLIVSSVPMSIPTGFPRRTGVTAGIVDTAGETRFLLELSP